MADSTTSSPTTLGGMPACMRVLAVLALLVSSGQSLALYKVVGPDGKVTYTDRPPPSDAGRANNLTRLRGAGGAGEDDAAAGLSAELRQSMARFPVTLYVSNECAPCESGRRLLQQRGIPFTERMVRTEEDAEALNRATGNRSVPTLTVGGQVLRGYADTDWQAYLDAAGYPRESKLPRNYAAPAATPLTVRKPEAAGKAQPEAPAAVQPNVPATPVPTSGPGGIRF